MGYCTGQVFEIVHPGYERAGGRRAVRQADRAVAGPGRSDLRVLHRVRADRDLLSRDLVRDAVAVLVEPDVPVADAREMRGVRQGVETVWRRGSSVLS